MTSKRLHSSLVNLLEEFEQIMGRYDFLEATRVIFRSTGLIAVARRRSVGPSVRPSTPVTQQPIFGSFSKSVGIFLG